MARAFHMWLLLATPVAVAAKELCLDHRNPVFPSILSSRVEEVESVSKCSICGPNELIPDHVPTYDTNETVHQSRTCSYFEERAKEEPSDSLLCSGLKSFFPQCCLGPPTYVCETRIRELLFKDQTYDSAVPPIVASYREPLHVRVAFEYQAVEEIDVQRGTGNILATIGLVWNDPRLAWQIGPENCADIISVKASNDVEKTEIWVPDFDLHNQIEGVGEFPDTRATVYSDGTTEWVRTGSLKTICQFQGLAQIPFDTLGCQLILGPRERSGANQVEYTLWDAEGGLTFGEFEPVYNEYTVVPELTEAGQTADKALVFYTIFFRRAKNYYVFNIVIPTIILTYLSFGTFLLDLRIGERLSYGMSLALVIVAQQIATGGLIPVSNERLWIDKFVGWSFYWVIFGLTESVLLGYLFFLRQDDSSVQDIDPSRAERKAALELVSEHQLNDVEGSSEEESYSEETDTVDLEQTVVPPGNRQDLREYLRRKLQQLGHPDDTDAPEIRTRKIFKVPLRKIDNYCFILTIGTYTCYVIAMFTSVERWGENVESDLYDETRTVLD